MSLYHEAAAILESMAADLAHAQGSFKSIIFAKKNLKSPATQLYALVIEATKWSPVLCPLVDKASLLSAERKLSPVLALLLVHDLLVSKKGIALPKDHGLRQCVEKHKARLGAEFTRARIQAKVASVDQWKEKLAAQTENAVSLAGLQHPRWVRLNTLREGDWAELSHSTTDLKTIVGAPPGQKLYAKDQHVAHLGAFPSGTDLTAGAAYKTGRIILQDKASCFPATLLNPQVEDGDIIDACAAPGNKTTHLAALLSADAKFKDGAHGTIYAVERDAARAQTLQKMTNTAGAASMVQCLPKQDFLKLSPKDPRFRNVGAILLDPSCSGSGIVGRDEGGLNDPPLVLPGDPSKPKQPQNPKSRKGKRDRQLTTNEERQAKKAKITTSDPSDEQDEQIVAAPDLGARLEKISNFQTTMVLHAMTFPKAQKIVYSTCSVHAEENENVVMRALTSAQARNGRWRILTRDEQVPGMQTWERRGDEAAVEAMVSVASAGHDHSLDATAISQACIRCAKGTEEGTMGFFAAGFIRDAERLAESESEWEGLSD